MPTTVEKPTKRFTQADLRRAIAAGARRVLERHGEPVMSIHDLHRHSARVRTAEKLAALRTVDAT